MLRCRCSTAFIMIGSVCALSACETDSMAEQRQSAAAASAPPTHVAVGPIPGEGGRPDRRAIRNPLGQDPTALQDGRRLFVAFNCSGCHGGRAGGGMGPSLRDADWIYGQSDAQIFDSIAAGRANGMPAWGGSLPEHEIWKLVSYVQSLRTEREPQAPPG